MAYNKEDEKSHHPSVIALMYSRDGGEAWETGKICRELSDASEFSVCQLSDGRIFANIRHEGEENCRAAAEISGDFSIDNIRFCKNLPDPVCCAGFVSLGDGFLFSNCDSGTDRESLTLKRLSSDFSTEGELLLSQEGGYSDIAFSAEKNEAYIIYEHGKHLDLCVVDIN